MDLDDDLFVVQVTDGRLTIRRDEPTRWDTAVRTDPGTFLALVIEQHPAGELADRLEITGDRPAFDRLMGVLAAV